MRHNVIKLHEHENVGTHWIAWYISNIDAIYFDSLGAGRIPKVIWKIKFELK